MMLVAKQHGLIKHFSWSDGTNCTWMWSGRDNISLLTQDISCLIILPHSICLPSVGSLTFRILFPSSVPASQRVERDVVGFKLTVGVKQQAPEMVLKLRLSTLKGPQKQASGVIVICVQIVPDKWGALEDWLHLSQGFQWEFPGNDLTACGKRKPSAQKSVKHFPFKRFTLGQLNK